jgi:hypothetical protein
MKIREGMLARGIDIPCKAIMGWLVVDLYTVYHEL